MKGKRLSASRKCATDVAAIARLAGRPPYEQPTLPLTSTLSLTLSLCFSHSHIFPLTHTYFLSLTHYFLLSLPRLCPLFSNRFCSLCFLLLLIPPLFPSPTHPQPPIVPFLLNFHLSEFLVPPYHSWVIPFRAPKKQNSAGKFSLLIFLYFKFIVLKGFPLFFLSLIAIFSVNKSICGNPIFELYFH